MLPCLRIAACVAVICCVVGVARGTALFTTRVANDLVIAAPFVASENGVVLFGAVSQPPGIAAVDLVSKKTLWTFRPSEVQGALLNLTLHEDGAVATLLAVFPTHFVVIDAASGSKLATATITGGMTVVPPSGASALNGVFCAMPPQPPSRRPSHLAGVVYSPAGTPFVFIASTITGDVSGVVAVPNGVQKLWGTNAGAVYLSGGVLTLSNLSSVPNAVGGIPAGATPTFVTEPKSGVFWAAYTTANQLILANLQQGGTLVSQSTVLRSVGSIVSLDATWTSAIALTVTVVTGSSAFAFEVADSLTILQHTADAPPSFAFSGSHRSPVGITALIAHAVANASTMIIAADAATLRPIAAVTTAAPPRAVCAVADFSGAARAVLWLDESAVVSIMSIADGTTTSTSAIDATVLLCEAFRDPGQVVGLNAASARTVTIGFDALPPRAAGTGSASVVDDGVAFTVNGTHVTATAIDSTTALWTTPFTALGAGSFNIAPVSFGRYVVFGNVGSTLAVVDKYTGAATLVSLLNADTPSRCSLALSGSAAITLTAAGEASVVAVVGGVPCVFALDARLTVTSWETVVAPTNAWPARNGCSIIAATHGASVINEALDNTIPAALQPLSHPASIFAVTNSLVYLVSADGATLSCRFVTGQAATPLPLLWEASAQTIFASAFPIDIGHVVSSVRRRSPGASNRRFRGHPCACAQRRWRWQLQPRASRHIRATNLDEPHGVADCLRNCAGHAHLRVRW
jgi:hypothetical protein